MNQIQPRPITLRPGASAVILNEAGQVLVQQRSDNKFWALPAGGQDVGESLAECCVREVKEECGLIVEIVRLVGVYSHPSICSIVYPDGNKVQGVGACFVCKVVAGVLQKNDESLELRWVSPNELPEPFWENHRVRLMDAMQNQVAAFWR